jgi:polyhydroxyalkanoate synthase subunit PhaC
LSTGLLVGPTRFVLGASGHIAGVIDPASKNKRNYRGSGDSAADAEGWLTSALEVCGSWWPDWAAWLKQFAGGEKPAPGRCVREKACWQEIFIDVRWQKCCRPAVFTYPLSKEG